LPWHKRQAMMQGTFPSELPQTPKNFMNASVMPFNSGMETNQFWGRLVCSCYNSKILDLILVEVGSWDNASCCLATQPCN